MYMNSYRNLEGVYCCCLGISDQLIVPDRGENIMLLTQELGCLANLCYSVSQNNANCTSIVHES